MALARPLLRVLLLLAVILSGTVPEGMMRMAGADGMAGPSLVLCTGDGPQEIRLLPDGAVVPADRGSQDDQGDHKRQAKCLSLHLGDPHAQNWAMPLPKRAGFALRRTPVGDQIAALAPRLQLAEARAPPLSV